LVKGKHVWKTTLAVADHWRPGTVAQPWLVKLAHRETELGCEASM